MLPHEDLISLMRRLAELERRLELLESQETGNHVPISTANVSSPPTDAQLDTAFGQPANLGEGFVALVDDNGANTAVWLVGVSGASWWYEALTLAT